MRLVQIASEQRYLSQEKRVYSEEAPTVRKKMEQLSSENQDPILSVYFPWMNDAQNMWVQILWRGLSKIDAFKFFKKKKTALLQQRENMWTMKVFIEDMVSCTQVFIWGKYEDDLTFFISKKRANPTISFLFAPSRM